MKTVFKIGMKVYDQVVFPNKYGRVVDIVEKDAFPIKVDLEGVGVTHSYTKDGRIIGKLSPTLSTSSYNMAGFEQKAPMPTFEEAWEEVERVYEPKSEYDKEEFGGYPSQDLANAAEALRRLLFLRDYYNGDWKPIWKKDITKYCIHVYKGELDTIDYCTLYKVMHFKTPEIRDKFFKEQKELLEIAKPLL